MNNQFTEEQKKNLKELNKKYSFKMFGLVAQCLLSLALADLLTMLTDIFYVHSKVFVFLASFASGFLFSQLFIKNIHSLGNNLKSDTLKILEDKSET